MRVASIGREQMKRDVTDIIRYDNTDCLRAANSYISPAQYDISFQSVRKCLTSTQPGKKLIGADKVDVG